MLGITSLPETPLEVNAVIIRDPSAKKSIFAEPSAHGAVPDIVLTPERAYVSDCRGTGATDISAEVKAALDHMGAALKAAGLDHRHMVFINPYMLDSVGYDVMGKVYAQYFEFGNTPARATINVAALPDGAHIEFTGVAVRDLSKRLAVRPKNMPPSPTASPCVFAGDTFYCSAKSGFIPGPHSGIFAESVEDQTRQTMRNFWTAWKKPGSVSKTSSRRTSTWTTWRTSRR